MMDLLGLSSLMRKGSPSKDPVMESLEQAQNKHQLKNRERRYIALGLGLPIVLAFLYFYGVGRNRYFVKSEVVVRKPQESVTAGLNIGTLIGGGNQGSIEDARYLRRYLESPQVLKDLESQFDFQQAYRKQGIDPFAGISKDAGREYVHQFYRRQVGVQLDEASGVMKITSIGYDPVIATRLNRFLNQQAETFVNQLNQDVYRKQLVFADQQVADNLQKVQQASDKLAAFQQNQQLMSAKAEAEVSGTLVAALEAELASQKVLLATLKRRFVDPQAPEIRQVEDQVQELQKQVQIERAALVSPAGRNLPAEAAQLAALEGDLLFKTELYKAALASAETTRIDSLRQARFLAVLSEPLTPDDPFQYWRHKGFFTVVAVLLVGFALTKFLFGMADSHRN